ncbi:MAG: N(4)-(beta-N-acetylglucosaminyl)-L-asparaginase [Saprospiraceae bacterium]
MNRREVMKFLTAGSMMVSTSILARGKGSKDIKPVVLSTWYNQAVHANNAAWSILKNSGTALDAVEMGVMVSENDWSNCCVGLGGNPDREGNVTLDASIMNHLGQCGGVAFLERIKNPIKVARAVMEKTPHVLLVGSGAQLFALEQGFRLEENILSDHAQNAFTEWKKKSKYQLKINIEKDGIDVPPTLPNGEKNHDTIGMIAIDAIGNFSGACTTSGLGFKMHGRVGDSPIIGAGLYVDNAVGAATATGNGEEVIRTCGSFLVVEFMRQGYSPEKACKKAVERIKNITPNKLSEIQIGFLALNKKGEFGGFALNKGFDFAVKSTYLDNEKYDAKSLI